MADTLPEFSAPQHLMLPKPSRWRHVWHAKWSRIGVGIAGVAMLVTAGLLIFPHTSFGKLGVDAALVEGLVEYRLTKDDAWERLSQGMSLTEGIEVRTGPDARAILNIDDGSAVRLNGNSSVALTKLMPNHIVIANTGGDIYTRVVTSHDRTFEVTADGATYQSLGTAYRTLNTTEKDGVEVYHSKVNILGMDKSGTVLVEQGERYYKVNKAAPDSEGKVTEVSQAELANDSFITWNSEQDKEAFKDELGVLFDLTPPALEISTPANGLVTDADSVEVKGSTENGAKVLINGEIVTNNNGQFAHSIGLNVGENGIAVEATDGAGNKTLKNLTVKRNEPATPATPKTSFKLTGSKVDDGISLSWNISGISASKGFKLVRSKDANPVYPGSDAVFLESAKRSYTWGITDGKTYHFRICVYTGSGCSSYSNDITVTAPSKVSEAPSGSLTLSHNGGSSVGWALNGSAPYGYKLVWSTSTNPTYPGSSATFYDKNATSGSITSTPGNYYVRICMYYDGSCVNYSNQLYFTVP